MISTLTMLIQFLFFLICLHLSLETCEKIANPNYLRAIPWVIGSLFFALLVIMWPNLQYCNIYWVSCKIKLCSNMKLLGFLLHYINLRFIDNKQLKLGSKKLRIVLNYSVKKSHKLKWNTLWKTRFP